jgi:hypothetical protein
VQPIWHHCLAGVLTGMVQTPIVAASDYAKIQVALKKKMQTKYSHPPSLPLFLSHSHSLSHTHTFIVAASDYAKV